MSARDTEFRDKMRELIEGALPDDIQKRLAKQAKDLFVDAADQLEWWIKDELSSQLAGYVQDMADSAIKSMLEGNEDMFRRYLWCEKGGGWTGRDRDHPVIHGRLSEASCIETRRKLCDTFPEVLKTERVLDLEDQVRSLVEQVSKLEREKNEMWERLR